MLPSGPQHVPAHLTSPHQQQQTLAPSSFIKGLPVPPNGTVNKNQQGVAVPTPHTVPSEGLKGPWRGQSFLQWGSSGAS